MPQPVQRVVSGRIGLTIDQSAVMDAADRVSDGAATRFSLLATAALERLADEARAQWPVRTGRSRDAFRVAQRITGDAVAVSLVNEATAPRWGFYAYKIKWSVRTRESIDAEVRGYGARAETQAGARAAEGWARRRIERRHGRGAPSAALASRRPWQVLVLTPARAREADLVAEARDDLARLAGGG